MNMQGSKRLRQNKRANSWEKALRKLVDMLCEIPELLPFWEFRKEIILKYNTFCSLHPSKFNQQDLALRRSPEGLKSCKEKKSVFLELW